MAAQVDSAPSPIEERVVTPDVQVLARTKLSQPGELYSSYPNIFTDASQEEHLIEFAGRACYQSFHNPAGRTTDGYIANIIEQRHFSVLEHANVTFYLQGVSRSLTHDLIRHRHHSYSQLSQRFVDSSVPNYVCPDLYRDDPQLVHTWLEAIRPLESQYAKLVYWGHQKNPNASRKQVREAARSVLPNCVETKIVVTGNLRAWRELLEKRWSAHADAEISEVAGMVVTKLMEMYPFVFNDITYDS